MKANTKTTEAVPVQVGSRITPTPWRLDGDLVRGSDDTLIAKVTPLDLGEGLANARLIAAAPALLEALKEVYAATMKSSDWTELECAALSRAEVAIAQAQGQPAAQVPLGATCPTANGHDLDRWEALQNELKHTKAALHEALQWHKDLCAALKALHLCKQAVENRSIPPSAREELVRDYSTPILQAYARR